MPLASAFVAATAAPPFPPMMPREGAGGGTVLIFQLIMIFGIFYFILIRPQRKQRQLHNQMLQQLTKGDRVMTNGGILGEIVHATDNDLTIRTAESTRIVVARGHIAQKIVEEETSAQEPDKGKDRQARDRGGKGPSLRGKGPTLRGGKGGRRK